ncbi:MAG: KUP/HAK/KT family potassium transporter [Bacteroidales bacterium]|nr:KUP/HAK/KT family potassium transporter [Bacteroidales bacterium]MBN2634189.1 KUP/HAK/KT family potassium transporter [Bacteroidales bacterium]
MKKTDNNPDFTKYSLAGALITLGIVFGDLGTSPLYAMRAIINGGAANYNELLIYGGLSCIFWTLTLSATIKYILITLRADNNGEGGIFALSALLRKKSSWAAILTMIGGSALLADAVITPAITVTSSVEGLRLYRPDIQIVPIVLLIIGILFFIQQFGMRYALSGFGPVMFVWFIALGALGISQLVMNPAVLRAVNPVYAYRFLAEYPGGFVLLGAVFLAVTGAEILYANLGQCGRPNIRVAWGFAKTALLLNYFGQGAWLLMNMEKGAYVNPFFSIMPSWFLIPGIILAVLAAIIASQAIISGSFILISEAVSLNFWPKFKILHPTWLRGQVYLPLMNWFLLVACSVTVIIFRESSNMNAAYGLAINITEILTTLLLSYYLLIKGVNHRLVLLFFMVFITLEGSFLIANLHKISHGGWFTILLASFYFLVMYGWYFGRKIKNRYITFADLDRYLDLFRDLSRDDSVPRFATNLVYIIRANRKDQVESKVIYSIFHKQPKRASIYWLLHVDRVEEPNRFDYQVTQIIPGILIRVDFHLGFKVEPKINLYFREVLEDLKKTGEIKLESSFDSLREHSFEGDFKFVLIDRILSRDYTLPAWENFTLALHLLVRRLSISDVKTLNLDPANTIEEQVPIILNKTITDRIKRII